MKKFLLLFCLLSVFFCRTAMADFYKWVDEKGETQITDYPPPLDKAAKDVEIHKSSAEDITNPQEDVQKSQKKKDVVVIYTKNDCKDCDKAREFLKSKNIPFTEYNMDTDANAAAKRKEIDDGTDVPFAVINKNHVYGFSESVYDRVLKTEP
ncbi:MAG: glutaredoxin family protein [Deltaproteobacteria bacterium]|nr:glutaredoxin family protein [Deltaproteobacteria bacterium]